MIGGYTSVPRYFVLSMRCLSRPLFQPVTPSLYSIFSLFSCSAMVSIEEPSRRVLFFIRFSPSFLGNLLGQCNAADELEGELFAAVHRDALDDFVKQPVVKLDGRLVFIEDSI